MNTCYPPRGDTSDSVKAFRVRRPEESWKNTPKLKESGESCAVLVLGERPIVKKAYRKEGH